VLVALDANLTDLMLGSATRTDGPPSTAGWWTQAHTDALEALAPPPPFEGVPASQRRELWACYWLRALASVWPSVLYTFSDLLYDENARAASRDPARARWLVGFATEVREAHPAEYRTIDPERAPGAAAVVACGVADQNDARHVSDAIGMACAYLLTNDGPLRSHAPAIEARWGLKVRRPSEFLIESVRRGASWPTGTPWPWEHTG
jgi:hypothetical protein